MRKAYIFVYLTCFEHVSIFGKLPVGCVGLSVHASATLVSAVMLVRDLSGFLRTSCQAN